MSGSRADDSRACVNARRTQRQLSTMLHSRAAVAGAGPSSSRHVSHQRCRTPARTASAAPMRRSRILTVAAASNQQGNDQNSSILDAFFVGKALAETLNERLGEVAGNVFSQATATNFGPDALLAEAAKRDAEFREEVRKFQEDVLARARTERLKSTGGAQLGAPPSQGSEESSSATSAAPRAGSPAPPAMEVVGMTGEKRDVSEAIDDLRSQVSRTRYELQKLRNKNN